MNAGRTLLTRWPLLTGAALLALGALFPRTAAAQEEPAPTPAPAAN